MNIKSSLKKALYYDPSDVTANKQALTFIVTFVVFAVILMPGLAMAEPWDNVATKVLNILNGGLTRTIAIIAVVACGIAAIAGKLSWDWVVKIVLGIVLIFGSAAIVDALISAAR